MNKYTYIAIFGFTFWIASTAYFGWNKEPINGYEGMADAISTILLLWGIVGDILKGVTWQKSTHITVAKEHLKETIEAL